MRAPKFVIGIPMVCIGIAGLLLWIVSYTGALYIHRLFGFRLMIFWGRIDYYNVNGDTHGSIPILWSALLCGVIGMCVLIFGPRKQVIAIRPGFPIEK